MAKVTRCLIMTFSSMCGGGQRFVEILCRFLPRSIKPYVLITRAGHPGNIFYHRFQPWLAPDELQYAQSRPDWPKRVAEFIDREHIDVLVLEEGGRIREIVTNCSSKPRVVFVKHVMDPRGDIDDNADIIDQVVCVSEKVRRTVREGIVIRNAVLPPEGCSVDVRTLFGIGPDEFVIGYIGRIDDNKNVDMLVDIAEAAGWKALIVGKQRVPVRQSHASVVVPTDVYYTANWYRAMNVFVLPSRMEGFPLAPMEALLCGTRVAMTHVSDFPVIFKDAISFFPPQSVSGAIAAIRAAPDPEIGQAIIRTELSVESMIDQYTAVLKGQ